jgi:hypothetical protein
MPAWKVNIKILNHKIDFVSGWAVSEDRAEKASILVSLWTMIQYWVHLQYMLEE